MKIVLDTNILVSGIFWGGTPAKLLELWYREKIQVLASESILAEYLKTIQKLSLRLDRPDVSKRWALVLPSRVKLISITKLFHLCRDPKDDMFINCAVGGKAPYIVSGDRDLLDLKQVMSVRIVDAKTFLRAQAK